MREHSASLLLLLLLSADFTFNGLHIIKHIFVPRYSVWNIRIIAYLDIYHLLKLFWVIVLFAYLLKATRCIGYAAWIWIFTFFLIDDTLLLHQKISDYIVGNYDAYFPNSFRLQPRFLELAVLAIAGIFLSAILAWAYLRSSHVFRKISKDISLFIMALVFFGVIIDLASAIKLGPTIIFWLEIVEDGGEMVVLSLLLWYVFLLAIRQGKPDLYEQLTKINL